MKSIKIISLIMIVSLTSQTSCMFKGLLRIGQRATSGVQLQRLSFVHPLKANSLFRRFSTTSTVPRIWAKPLVLKRVLAPVALATGIALTAKAAKAQGKDDQPKQALDPKTAAFIDDIINTAASSATNQEILVGLEKQLIWQKYYQEQLNTIFALIDSKNSDQSKARNYIDKELFMSQERIKQLEAAIKNQQKETHEAIEDFNVLMAQIGF